jgi:glycosyltransferase involved in cell wall biosynthesis
MSSAPAPLAASPALPVDTAAAPPAIGRVLHIINGEHYAGAERVQDLLAGALPEFGAEVVFAALKPGKFRSARANQQARLFECPMRHRVDWRPISRIARLVRHERAALLHTHTPRTLLVGRAVAAMTGVPLVHHVHSPTSRDSTRRWRNLANSQLERWALRGAARAIAVSAAMGRYAASLGVPANRIDVVTNGVPGPRVLADRTPPAGRWTLGMVALFRPRKGVEVLLEALSLLRKQGLDVCLRAIGEFETPDYERQVRGLAQTRGLEPWIEWTGFCSNVPAALRDLDALVLPSLFGEGLPMVLLEAMAAGVPVVATKVEGVPEAIADGREGALVEPQSAQALAAGIERLVRGQLDWTALRANARQRYESQFSVRHMAEAVSKVYREVLGC